MALGPEAIRYFPDDLKAHALPQAHCALIALGVRIHHEINDIVERLCQKKRQDLVVDAALWVKQHIACPREERTRQLYAIYYSGKLVESRRGDS